jgi:hypothetical protein
MKKSIILFLMCLMMASIAGCGGGNPPPPPPCGQCGFLPNSRVVIRFPDGFLAEAMSDVLGCLRYPKHNGSCGQVFPATNLGLSLTASPSSINLNAQPWSATVYGQSMSATYGMPQVKYFDGNGFMVGKTTATWVSADGTQMTAPVPDLSGAWSGTYQLVVTNKKSNGLYTETVGSAWVNCWGRDRPDSDGDGVYDDQDCYPMDPSRWNCFEPGGGCGPQNPGGPQMPCTY